MRSSPAFAPACRPRLRSSSRIEKMRLAVPAHVIFQYEGKPHVAARKPGGNIELRAVTIGLSNGNLVEITQGISNGDDVILNHVALLNSQPHAPVSQPSTSSGSSRTPPDRKP